MFGGFKRSGLFGIFGVIAVAAIVAAIGLSSESGDASPKTTYALIFGVVGVFLVILFALQRADLNRVSGADARGSTRAAAEGGRQIDNPTRMSDPDLWAAMAVKPIDPEAVKARAAGWETGRRSQNLAMLVTLLIFLTVPPIYFLESFVPLLIGGPLIVIAALWGSIRALMPGGEMDRGYENVGVAMAPLGFEVTERPSVGIETRDAVTGRVGPKIQGALVLEGERNGRRVSVRLGSTETTTRSEVTVAAPVAAFKAKSRDGRVRPSDGAPQDVVAALKSTPNSTRWRKVTVEGGPQGIEIVRKGGNQADWLCDLWLAERLAEG
ncbi:MAG TPA: hypothetical protein VFM94_04760 [Solirubrobacterales bacterium]|nr:hypothetical protein [Solirubrobacterales bacterium]